MTVKAFYGDENIRTFDDGVRACIEHTPLDLSQRNILMTHHFVVSGSMRPEISDSEMQLSVGGIEEVDAEISEILITRPLGIFTGLSGSEVMSYAMRALY